MDSTLQSMMAENSMDFVKKFADLAEQIEKSENAAEKSSQCLKDK